MSRTFHPLIVGEPIRAQAGNHELVVMPQWVSQRNWSRVGTGSVTLGTTTSQKVFLKQFMDGSGVVHPDHFGAERDGRRAAAAVQQDGLLIPDILAESASNALLVYPALDIITPDELLRQDPAAFAAALPSLLQAMAAFLHGLPGAATVMPGLKRKRRPFTGSVMALNFKGLDIRNIGLPVDARSRSAGQKPIMFDFGRPYLAPVEEAAAKIFVSCGLLNWGRPLGRFMSGPDPSAIEAAATALAPYLDRDAIIFEVEHEARNRLRELPQGANPAIRFGKQAVISTVGRWHLRRLRSMLSGVSQLRVSAA